MKEDSFWTIIKADILRYTGPTEAGVRAMIKEWGFAEGLVVVIFFRLGHKATQLKIPFLPVILKIIYAILTILLGIRISFRAQIGRGLYIGHYGGILVGPIEMGKYCTISNQVTIGFGGLGTNRQGLPKIGEYVYIGPGAKILGKIRIGNNVSIGANTVVSKNIPDNAIVVGNPGRIVGYQGKNEYIQNADE
jgi:serine O-acetyltransferase